MEGFLLNEQTWLQHLKEKRLAYGLSQNRLAVATGITRQYLSDIETGKVKPSEDLQQSLWEALERFNPDAPLEMLFDYVRIRFPTTDVQQVVENILQLKLSYFLHEDYGFYSYSEHYALGDIFVLCSHELDKGVLVELKGRGCRQFESYLLAQQRSWYEFFMDVLVAGGVMKRLDLAINDKTGILNIPVLTEKCQQEECISVFRSFKSYRSGELVRKEEKECMGNTLYIGSLQSEVYFCIYEKDYEQYKKNDIPIEDAEVKNRFEIRLKNERAYYAVRDLLVYDNPEHTAFKIINRYIRFVDKDDSKPRSDWKLNEEWAWFIGNNRERLKLTTKPEPYSFQRTLNWLSHQVAPTLKIAIKLDEINQTLSVTLGSNYVNDYTNNGRVQQVIIQADAPYRMQPEQILTLSVKNRMGQMVQVSTFATLSWHVAPQQLTRYQGYSAIRITGNEAPGESSGTAMKVMESLSRDLPQGMAGEWAGSSLQERKSESQLPGLIVLSILVVFMVLAALYESWSIPFAVMLVVPLGLIGAVIAVSVADMTNDVFFKVGLITLIGLSAKNAILIVEFARQLHRQGQPLLAATIHAAGQRLRPILMTSLAFTLGVVPLMLANGASDSTQHAIGTGVFGGMISGTLLAIFFVPVFFIVIARFIDNLRKA